MMGYTHMAYGFLVAEILWVWKLQNTPLQKQYNRITCWLLGMFGAFIPDLDGVTSIFSNLTYEHYPWSSLAIEIYHRTFSHGLVFLTTTILIVILVGLKISTIHPERTKVVSTEKPENPLGNLKEPKEKLPIIMGFIFVGSFLLFNSRDVIWMNIALGIILLTMVLFAWSFVKIRKPYYAVIIFSAAISHQICDFVNCEWNPYGPWDPSVLWGLYLWCGSCGYCTRYGIVIPETPNPQFLIMLILFEVIPPIIVLYRFLLVVAQYRIFKLSPGWKPLVE